MPAPHPLVPRLARFAVAAVLFGSAVGVAQAATSDACTGGAFSALGQTGKGKVDLQPAQLPATFSVKGKYAEFDVDR